MASLIQRPGFSTYYIQHMVSGKAKRFSTGTDSLQIAKEKLRQFESACLRGDDSPLPSKTPIATVVAAYVSHIRSVKTGKSAQTDTYYLRDAFGPICPELEINSRKVSEKTKKRPPKPGQDRRRKAQRIEAQWFEQITTADIAGFVRVRSRIAGSLLRRLTDTERFSRGSSIGRWPYGRGRFFLRRPFFGLLVAAKR